MDAEHFEVVVVGGGPAGSAAARTLAAAGRDVCLIDRAIFPREKLCGGLVTLRSKKIFERTFGGQWKNDLFVSSTDVAFFSNGKLIAAPPPYSRLFFTMRFDFDNYLLGLARQAGAQLKLGESLSNLDLRARVIQLASGINISFDYLIGADGVNSQIAKSIFGHSFDPNTIGFGLEVEVPRANLPDQSDRVEIDFAAARWGYGWVFPKKATFTIGVGGIHKLNPDLRKSLDRYLQHKGLSADEFKVKGQYIPFGDYRKRPGKGCVLLCGDAAGTVDPITGEGIAYAMQSGEAAAQAIIKSTRDKCDNAFDLYLSEYKNIATPIQQATFWRRLIFPKLIQKPFAWAFADASTLQKGYLDILAGERDYNSLYSLFGVQVVKAVRKLFSAISLKLFGGRSFFN
jgi:geranylgeranyl reductase family protein